MLLVKDSKPNHDRGQKVKNCKIHLLMTNRNALPKQVCLIWVMMWWQSQMRYSKQFESALSDNLTVTAPTKTILSTLFVISFKFKELPRFTNIVGNCVPWVARSVLSISIISGFDTEKPYVLKFRDGIPARLPRKKESACRQKQLKPLCCEKSIHLCMANTRTNWHYLKSEQLKRALLPKKQFQIYWRVFFVRNLACVWKWQICADITSSIRTKRSHGCLQLQKGKTMQRYLTTVF